MTKEQTVHAACHVLPFSGLLGSRRGEGWVGGVGWGGGNTGDARFKLELQKPFALSRTSRGIESEETNLKVPTNVRCRLWCELGVRRGCAVDWCAIVINRQTCE